MFILKKIFVYIENIDIKDPLCRTTVLRSTSGQTHAPSVGVTFPSTLSAPIIRTKNISVILFFYLFEYFFIYTQNEKNVFFIRIS
jgi:hypothetical protein